MIPAKEKAKVITKIRSHEKDTGSTEVQLAILSEEIRRLALHLKDNPKDNHSRRGLLAMVARRKKLLDYLARNDPQRHAIAVRKLGLKR